MAYSVQRVAGMNYERDPRDVVFLESTEDGGIDAKRVFDALSQKHKDEMRNKFEYWQRGQHQDRYFHGFNDPVYRECFVFKRKQAGTYHRFYGFLIHPRPRTQPRYQVCVLVSHAQKNQENTDPSELNSVNQIRMKLEVIAAIKRKFPERTGGTYATLDKRKY